MQTKKQIVKEIIQGNRHLKRSPASLSLGTSDLSPSLVKRGGLQSLPKKNTEFSYNQPRDVYNKLGRLSGPLFAGSKAA
jgi:hypothetical protein